MKIDTQLSGDVIMSGEQSMTELVNLAGRIYDIDERVYKATGSALGRVFYRNREKTIDELLENMCDTSRAHIIRNEFALIGNMARTIPNRDVYREAMTEYNEIVHQLRALTGTLGKREIINATEARLNSFGNAKAIVGAHKIICISRSYGAGGDDIGFGLADKLKINYYDAEIFKTVSKRLEAESDEEMSDANFELSQNIKNPGLSYATEHMTLKARMARFNRYHGLSARDALFFTQSELLCDLAQKEDFVVMGRCADVIMSNNHIPHVSIYITAPFKLRAQRMAEINDVDMKQAVKQLKQVDRRHASYYNFYTGRKWGNASNYDICINSARYGIKGSIEFIANVLNGTGNSDEK
jgi:cytidylate kinase